MTISTPNTHARTGSAPKHERPLTTDADVGALPRPRKGRRDYHVRDVPGLMVRVSPDSVRFIVRKRGPRPNPETPGRIWKIVVGQFPTMTMHDAREEARVLVGRIERGEEPRPLPQPIRSAVLGGVRTGPRRCR